MQERICREPNERCPKCECYSVNSASRICELCQSDYSSVALVDELFGGKHATLERYEVELTITKKMVIEVDPRKMNKLEAKKLSKLIPQVSTVEGHLWKVATEFSQKNAPGDYGIYGLVRVDGKPPAGCWVDDSGLNIWPQTDNSHEPLARIRKISNPKMTECNEN
jgi:hypothetical protein